MAAKRTDNIGKMKGGVRKRGTGPTASWSFTLDMGLQPAQRCVECGRREWLGQKKLEQCPKCSGRLRETRERRLVEESGYRTRTEASDARAEKLRLQRNGLYVAPVRMTLAEYLRDRWLPAVKGEGLKPTTLASYEKLIDHHLIGPNEAQHRIGMTPLQKLTRDAIKAHYAELAKNGRSDGKGGLAPASVRRVHATLSRALSDAVESGILMRNPAAGVARRLPRVSRTKESLKAWDAKQLAAFLAATKKHRNYALFHLVAMTGMRRGEALALRWADIDLEQGFVSISKSRSPVGSKVEESGTKTERCRVVQLDPDTVEVLKAAAEKQAGEMAKASNWPEEPYVFTTREGNPLDPRSVSGQFAGLVAKAKLPSIPFHGLRHTHATVALQAGVHPKVVQERLGHASIAITLDTYSHVIRQLDVDAAVTIANIVKAGSPEARL